MKTKYFNGGHYPDYIREAFVEATEAFRNWSDGEPEPTVTYSYVSNFNVFPHEVVERTVTISEVCGLLWNCTDILPWYAFEDLDHCGIEPKSRTYAAAARAVLEAIKNQPVPV